MLISGHPDVYKRQSRLIALSTMWHGREKRRIGLNQHPIERHFEGGVANQLRLRKRDVSRERNHEPQIERLLRVLPAPRETVQNPAQAAAAPVLAQQLQTIFPGVVAALRRPAVNHHRQPGRLRQLKLLQENQLLHLAGRVIVKVIQPNLSPGNHFRSFRESLEFREVSGGREFSLVGMNSNAGIDEFMRLRQPNATVERPGPGAAPNRDNGLDSSLPRPRHHLLAVAVESFPLEMCVRVYEHGAWWFVMGLSTMPAWAGMPPAAVRASPLRSRYLSLVPTATSSKNAASTAFPPSGAAATIIPFDSSPRSFRGARLATTTTFRPIRASGA